jgi:hypothetical protein
MDGVRTSGSCQYPHHDCGRVGKVALRGLEDCIHATDGCEDV